MLCSVLAGSGHCIRAPNGEREGVVRSGISPQGVRPVWLRPGLRRGNTTHFVVDGDHGSVGRWPMATMARRAKGSTPFMLSCCRWSVDPTGNERLDQLRSSAQHGCAHNSIGGCFRSICPGQPKVSCGTRGTDGGIVPLPGRLIIIYGGLADSYSSAQAEGPCSIERA